MGISWYYPSAMTAFLLFGFAFSIGHHYYYASLDGKSAANQEWAIRIGTGFSFLIKSCYAASLAIAVKQFVWARVRRTACPISTIDALFAVTTDITSLLTVGLWGKAPAVAIIGVIFWLIPLAVIVTPSTLSVTTAEVISPQPCNIPVLDFRKEYDFEYRSPQRALPNVDYSRMIDSGTIPSGWHPSEGLYAGPSPFLIKHVNRVFVSGQILDTPSICGPNCTYNASVPGIGYQCAQLDPGKEEDSANIDLIMDNLPLKAPLYHAYFSKDRRIWAYVIQMEGRGTGSSHEVVTAPIELFTCEPQRVVYDVTFRFINNVRTMTFGKERIYGRVPWKTFPSNGSLSSTYNETNYWAYQSLADVLAQHVNGTMWMPRNNEPSTDTLLSYTPLVGFITTENPNITVLEFVLYPKLNFRDKLAELVRNFSISLLAEPSVHIYTTEPGECQVTNWVSRWKYNETPLWIAYGSLCFIGMMGLVLGAFSINFNGCTSDMAFSKVVCTTRNTTLDQAAMDSHFGVHPLPKELLEAKLQFGEIAGENHAGFGLEHQITKLEKGRCEPRLA
ncbi:uncharacterized protein B0J16DRAFT_369055 [Fusarium flagelliforme]|uniref:uncharacterized protein n=1 Tax=Fusarium flagelliforme TaxID=2675880 RepID=UPI001E8EE9A7|nr:uncharacterized protein B0J16DRAFT_369055 [Fusarium flagelliforme]KAH7192875.1 hypothetical protein B0J16DRAFT_369055 [Fusarium flagelliforme]